MYLLLPTHVPYFCNIFSWLFFSLFFNDIHTCFFYIGKKKKSHFPLATLLFLFQCYILKGSLYIHRHYFILSTDLVCPAQLPYHCAVLMISTVAQAESSRGQLLLVNLSSVSIICNSAFQHLLTLTTVPVHTV